MLPINNRHARCGYDRLFRDDFLAYLAEACEAGPSRRCELISWEVGQYSTLGLEYVLHNGDGPYIICLNVGQLHAEHLIALTDMGVELEGWVKPEYLRGTDENKLTILVTKTN